MYWTYALFSEASGSIYIGQTNNLARRFREHNSIGEYTHWTIRNSDWKLLYFQVYSTRSEAMKREKQLKTGQGRAFLRSLIPPNKPPEAII